MSAQGITEPSNKKSGGILSGELAGQELIEGVYVLPGQGNTLAIETDAGIVLVDASLSRRHALVTVDTDGASITDAGSTNGVLVDGKVINGPTRLGADQPILVGQTWFVVDHHVGEGWPGTGPAIRF